jgi:hypothetical protein
VALCCARLRTHRKRTLQPARGDRSHRNDLPTTADLPGFAAQEPEHCHDCYRLIRRGERCFLTREQAIVCPDCIGASDAIRLTGGLTVEVGEDRLLVRRGSAVVEVFPHEVRHLVDALVEAAVRLVDQATGE